MNNICFDFSLYEALNNEICVSSQDHIIIFANDAFRRSFGNDAVGDLYSKRINDRSIPCMESVHSSTGSPSNSTGYEIKLSGSSEYRTVTNSLMANGNILTQMHDISELKLNEKYLNACLEQIRITEQLAKLGHWKLDIVNNVLHWSDEIYHIFDVSHKSFDPSYEFFLSSIHPEDRELVNDAYLTSVQNHSEYEITHRLLLKNNVIKYVLERGWTDYDMAGAPLHSTGLVWDVTEQKLAELKRKQSIDKLRRLLRELPQPIVIADPDARIQEVNQSFLVMYEMESEDVLNHKP